MRTICTWCTAALALAAFTTASDAQDLGARGVFVTMGPTFPVESGDLTGDTGFNFGFGIELFASPNMRISGRMDVHSVPKKGEAVAEPVPLMSFAATQALAYGSGGSPSWQAFDFIVGFRLFPMKTRVRPYADIGFGWLPSETSEEALPFGSQIGAGIEWRTGWKNGGPTLSVDYSNLQAGENLRPLRFGVRIP